MPDTLTLLDRLRIERVVWSLDQRLYDLPRKVRIAHRREVRQNLTEAATDVGIGSAVRHLGDVARLAREYRSAALGDGPHPSWIAAITFLLTGQLVFTAILTEAAKAFGSGISAADPHASGTFSWEGIRYLQDTVTFTFVDGHGTSVGGAWTPIAYIIWALCTVLIGRLWRATPAWHRRHTATTVA